jgi:hypothetical protein
VKEFNICPTCRTKLYSAGKFYLKHEKRYVQRYRCSNVACNRTYSANKIILQKILECPTCHTQLHSTVSPQ